MEFEIEGSDGVGIADGYDQLEVTGDLTLLGDLNVTIPNSFSPHIYDRFTLIKYGGSLTESYTETLDPAFASWSLESLAPNEINLVSTPICAYTKVTWDGSSNSKWDNLSNWEYNFVPIPCHEVLIPSTSIGPILQSTVNAKIQKLEIIKGSLDIQGTLKVDGRNQNKNLVSITLGSLENNGLLNITSGERYKGYGVFVDINSNLTNNDVMWIKNIEGDLSSGIINNGVFTNKGTLNIENINGIGIYNDRGATFDATKFGQVTMDICNTGIYNRLNSLFYINCSFELLSPVSNYAFYNTNATLRVDGSGHFIGVADAAQGSVNSTDGSFIVRGIVE